jgi:peptidoglycan hydrolase CwlO-like protein
MLNETGIAQFSAALYAAVAALIISGVFKFINNIADKDKNKLEMHLSLRKELREELDAVKAELHRLQEELDEWKHKYFQQVELTNELKVAILSLNEELSEYKNSPSASADEEQ